MKPFPASNDALVVRTDFSDDAAWRAVCAAISEPVEGFLAYVQFVDDPAFSGASVDRLVELGRDIAKSFLIAADAETMRSAERTLLVLDLMVEPGRTFRAVPSAIQSVENNLSIANMDFREFADNVDPDGVFRMFR